MTTLIPKFDLKNGGLTPTGAINRSIYEKLSDFVSVKDFGAVGDGVTDDTVAIQNCLNSFTQATGGGTVYFPPGTYITSASLIVDVHGMTLIGTKGSSWIKRADGVAPDTMNLLQTGYQGRYTPGAQIFDFTMIGMSFDGNKANNTMGVDDNFDEGVSLLYASRCYISDCYVKNVLRIGMPLSTQANDSTVQGCVFQDCNEGGLYAEVSSNVTFVGNIIKNCSAAPFNIGAISMNQVTNGSIVGNVVSNSRDGIYIRNSCNNISISGNSINTSGRNGIWVLDESLGVGPSTPTNISITGNAIKSATSNGIIVGHASNIIISSNSINSCETGIYINNDAYVTISSNNITNSGTTNFNNYGGNTYLRVSDIVASWAPTIIGESTAGTGTYTVQTGRYEYVGSRIVFNAVLVQTSHTGTGVANFVLPISMEATIDSSPLINMQIANTSYTGTPLGIVYAGTVNARIYANNNGSFATLSVPSGAATYYVSGSYEFSV